MMTDFLRTHKMAAAALAALVQCGILLYMIQSRASILQNGAEVVLRTEPVDPRDLLRGDYVTLGYAISSFPATEIDGDLNRRFDESSPVYVALKKGPDGVWEKSRASVSPISDLRPDEVLIAGRALYGFTPKSSDTVRVNYGIERFYVPEGEGRGIESERNERRIDAVIMISAKGKAQMKRLMDAGVALYEEPVY
jgi:uncharacterized membrane-anchored protein